jgi:hypothetical protein
MFPIEKEADGLLVTGYGPRVQKWLGGLAGNADGTSRNHAGGLPVPWVDVDHEATGRAGARHLGAVERDELFRGAKESLAGHL